MSEDGADLRFDSPQHEIKHWKSKAAELQDVLRETESMLQDVMEGSKELETEMEKEIADSTKSVSDLKRRNDQLTGDLEDWKSKYSRALSEHNSTLTNLQKELALLRESVDIYKTKLRDTELTNDELENAERMVASSLADMEGRYNKTIEKTALLEEELIEKTRLEEENQRLKDELREMTEEMTVLRDVLRASVRAATRTAGIPSTPRSVIPANGAAGSKRTMAEMIAKMKALEARINSAKDLSRVVGPGDESAIPRPSSRMATFGSPGANGHQSFHIPASTPRTPRASMDGNRTIGSSIPVPSRVRRPSSRFDDRGTPPMPSLGLPRSQTPNTLHARVTSRGGGSSPLPPHEFMDHDPASTLPHVARYAAAQAALSTPSAGAAKRRTSIGSGMTHSSSYGSLAKIRSGSTIPRSTTPSTVAAPRVTQSSMTHYGDVSGIRTPLSTRLASSHRNGSSARGSVTGPPSSWKSAAGREVAAARSRTGSTGANEDL
uniref:NUDE domain-containing protein n=1 Tax=Kalmanozyma brasiliensis (strain GHG001) TaxID=1365824 RepID=V5EPR2_KALBG